MSGIPSMIHLGAGALAAHKQRMATHQHNVANASTPGHRRARVHLESLGSSTGAPLYGVRAGHAQSVRAPLLDRVVPERRGDVAEHSALHQAGDLVESVLAQDDLEGKLSAFFSGARGLEVDGRHLASRRAFLHDAEALAGAIRGRHEALSFQRDVGLEQAQSSVDELNGLLKELETIEGEMMTLRHAPGLVDTRDELVSQVARLTGARVVPERSGRVSLVTSSGTALFEGGRARELALHASPDKLSYTLGKPERALSGLSGELGGFERADQEVFGKSLHNLDAFASSFADEVNALHAQGVDLAGAQGAPLYALDPTGAASTLAVRSELLEDPSGLALASDVASLPGGAQIAQRLAQMEEMMIQGDRTAHDMIQDESSRLGSIVARAAQERDTATASLEQVEALQASISGVSLEEEMIALTQAQRAYEASVKLVQTADELMQTILSLR